MFINGIQVPVLTWNYHVSFFDSFFDHPEMCVSLAAYLTEDTARASELKALQTLDLSAIAPYRAHYRSRLPALAEQLRQKYLRSFGPPRQPGGPGGACHCINASYGEAGRLSGI